MTYDQKGPRRLNFVSFLFFVAIAAGIYLGVKFVPVWWQSRQVDATLDELKMPAMAFAGSDADIRDREAERILSKAVQRLRELGVQDQADQPLEVWFSPEYDELHARYEVIVEHNFGSLIKPTVMRMHRIRKVPQ